MVEFTFTVPGEPIPQERAGEKILYNDKGPYIHHYDPEKSKTHKKIVRVLAKAAMSRAGIREPLIGPVKIEIIVYRKHLASFSEVKRQAAAAGEILPATLPDGKNYLWLIEDALNKLAYKDDGQITDIVVLKRYAADPRTQITISQVGRAANG